MIPPVVLPPIHQVGIGEHYPSQQMMIGPQQQLRTTMSLPPILQEGYQQLMPHVITPIQLQNISSNPPLTSSSSKKAKKKKSKKKHKKHHHHKCDKHHHHKHHKHHKSTCPKSHKKDKDDSMETSALDAAVPSITGTSTQAETMQVDPPTDASSQLQPPSIPEATNQPKEFSLKFPLKNETTRSFYVNFLTLILKAVQQRDPQNFFAWPVTDAIAPGYSSFIKTPMDLSTIKKKIDHYVYETVYEMRSDVKQMCENAMTYNLPDTVYYKSAKKLWYQCKEKIFSKDSLLEIRSQAEFMKECVNSIPPSIAIMENANIYAQYGVSSSPKKKASAKIESISSSLSSLPQSDIFGFTAPPPPPPPIKPMSPVKTLTPSIPAAPIIEKPPEVVAPPVSTNESENPSEPTVVYPSLDKILAIGVKKPEPEQEPSSSEEEDDSEEAEAARILSIAQKAATAAAGKLSLERPNGVNYSCLRQQKDGSTTLSIIGSVPNNERYLKIEDLVGKLPEGTPFLPSYNEPESNRVKVVENRDVGPFGSYLPSLDSSKSSLSKEESSLILSVYGDEETCIPYAHSLLSFAGDSEYLIKMTDGLLDVLTQGQHSKEMREFLKRSEEDKEGKEDKNEESSSKSTSELEEKLTETENMINTLESLQKKRLSSTTRATPASIEEVHLAHLLTEKLTQVISSFSTPVDVTDISTIRKALGITLKNQVHVS
jgi:bromodomain-containing protein 7/9